MRKRIPALLILIISLVSFAVYFSALSNAFVYDDTGQVLENRWIRDVKYLPDIFSKSVWSFQGETVISNYYRPLMHLIFMFNYYVFGLRPWGFHLVNILFHAGASILVFVIASRLLRASSNPSQLKEKGFVGSLLSPPFIGAVLFATHPIHTEAVAWVSGAPELSYTFFSLLSLYLYMRYEEGTKGMYPLSVVSFSVAAFCKEPALTLPVILMAYDSIFGKKGKGYLPFIKRYVPYLLVAGVYLGLRYHALGGFSPQEPHIVLSAYGYIINVFPLFLQYLGNLLLPLNLNAFHVLHPISSIFETIGLVSLAATAAFVGVTFIAFKKKSKVCFALLVIALPLLPSLYIPAVGENVFAERYLYLPSFGFVLLIALALSWAKTIKPKVTSGLVIISLSVAVVYSVGTVSRNAVWRDDLTLFTDTVRKSPDAALPHNNRGNAYLDQNRLDEAVIEFITALKLKPDDAKAHNNLGNAYVKRNRVDEAVNEFITALKLNPDNAEARYNLGTAYLEQNRGDEAVNEFITALKLKPDDAKAHNNLGNAYLKQNRVDEAVNEFITTLKLEPDYAEARYNLGTAYLEQNRVDEAVNEFVTTLKLKPDYAEAHHNLGTAYVKQNRVDEAVNEFITTLKLKPDYAEAHHNLGTLYLKQNRLDEAVNEFITTLKLRPDYAEAHNNLGIAYGKQNRVDEAVNEFIATLKLKPDYAKARYNLQICYQRMKMVKR
ncbi:MAG: tetratricopeptide repeat protein [Thermodesulfovibrionales bacterium]|jgi:tetratricopeptide (TPR) repeat protein